MSKSKTTQLTGVVVSAGQLRSLTKTWECTSKLRRAVYSTSPDFGGGVYLQQMWTCLETDETEWRLIPMEQVNEQPR